MHDQGTGQFEPATTLHYFKKAIQIIRLDQLAMVQVARDPSAIRFGIAVTAIGGALAFVPGNSLVGLLVGAFFSVIVLFLFAGFVHLLCGYSKGREEFMGFVRIIGLSGIMDWAIIIPFASLAVSIWSIVISVAAAQQVYHLTRGKAIFTVLVSALILWTVSLMILAGPLSFIYRLPGQ
jgi:hypothetical protein